MFPQPRKTYGSDCWLWLVALPGVSLVRSDTGLVLDPNYVKAVSELEPVIRILVSASHWSGKSLLSRYKKSGELVFADSGGAQFIDMPTHRMREFYKVREEMYRSQMYLGDVVAAGDVPGSKSEMTEEQIDRSLRMTIENTELQFSIGGESLGSRFINALHGVSPKHQLKWYEAVRRFPSKGWAIGVKPVEVAGTLLQLFFLYERGELKKGTLLHIFGTGASSMLYGLWWVSEQLGLEVQWSVDCSSHSLQRFGRIVLEDNLGVLFSEIRSGAKQVTLYDGTVLTDIPRKMTGAMTKKIYVTSARNYVKYWQNFVAEYEGRTPKFWKSLEQDKVQELYRWFRLGGTELLWDRVSSMVPGREEVSFR